MSNHPGTLILLCGALLLAGCRAATQPQPATPQPAPVVQARPPAPPTRAPEATPTPTSPPAATPYPLIPITDVVTATARRLDQAPGEIGVVAFADPQHGWLTVGTMLYATEDGGTTWQERTRLDSAARQLQFSSPSDGLAETQTGWFATSDGGASWQPTDQRIPAYAVTSNPCEEISTLLMINAQTGWRMCTSNGFTKYMHPKILYRTDNAGISWTEIGCANYDVQVDGGLPLESSFSGWSFLDAQHGLLTTTGGVYVTADGGYTWAEVSSNGLPPADIPYDLYFEDVYSFDTNISFVRAVNWYTDATYITNLYRTDDNGAQWRMIFKPPPAGPFPQ